MTATGSTQILFQFDGGSARALGIMPDVTGAGTVRTWFKGYRYYGGFRYERINGGNLTVVNIVDMETYIKGVVPYEMSNSWPLEALKAQAICARSYAYNNILQNKHKSYHFDVCNTTDCPVYCGAGSNSSVLPAERPHRPGGGGHRRPVRLYDAASSRPTTPPATAEPARAPSTCGGGITLSHRED